MIVTITSEQRTPICEARKADNLASEELIARVRNGEEECRGGSVKLVGRYWIKMGLRMGTLPLEHDEFINDSNAIALLRAPSAPNASRAQWSPPKVCILIILNFFFYFDSHYFRSASALARTFLLNSPQAGGGGWLGNLVRELFVPLLCTRSSWNSRLEFLQLLEPLAGNAVCTPRSSRLLKSEAIWKWSD